MPKPASAVSQTVLYGFSIVAMKGISILMLPFIAQRLTQPAFGRLEVLSSLAVVISIIVGLGLEDTLYRFAGQAKTIVQRRSFAARIFGLGIVLGAVSLAIVWSLAPALSSSLPGNVSVYEIRVIMMILALEGAIAIPMGWLRMENHARIFFGLSVSRAVIQATLTFVMLQPGNDITPVLEASLIAAVIQAAVLAFLQIRDTGISIRFRGEGALILYSLPIVGSGLVAFALNGLDRWILADQVGLVEVAEYGIAAKFALAAVLLLQPFGMWWSPKRFQIADQSNGKEAAVKAISIGIGLCLIICVCVATGAPILIKWLIPASYVMASEYALGLVLAMTLRELSELVNIGCYINRSTLSQLWINIATTLVGLVIMLTTVSSMGVWGVITALICAQMLRLILFYLVSQYFFRLEYPSLAIALLGVQTIGWLAFAPLFDVVNHQLVYALIAGSMISISAVALRLIPLSLTGSLRQLRARLVEW
jgi:O-antigen/teichoic acid export membrane protein